MHCHCDIASSVFNCGTWQPFALYCLDFWDLRPHKLICSLLNSTQLEQNTNTTEVSQIATETSFQPKSPCFQEEPENIPVHSTGQQTIPLRYTLMVSLITISGYGHLKSLMIDWLIMIVSNPHLFLPGKAIQVISNNQDLNRCGLLTSVVSLFFSSWVGQVSCSQETSWHWQ
jgi:hypothetical protein